MSAPVSESLLAFVLLFCLIGDSTAEENAFWDCLTLKDDCLFFSGKDPYLIYFAFGVIGLYSLFMTVVFTDLKFWWNIDNFQTQIDKLIERVKSKMKKVLKRREQPSVKELASRQLKRSQQCQRMVAALRYMVVNNIPLNIALPSAALRISGDQWIEDALCDPPNKSPKPSQDYGSDANVAI